MESIYIFLIRNDVWMYLLSAFGIIWYLNRFRQSQLQLRSATFGVEREVTQQKQNNSLLFLAIFSSVILLITYVNWQIAPTIATELLKPPTPTRDIFATPLSSPTPLNDLPQTRSSPTPPLIATLTLNSPNNPIALTPNPIATLNRPTSTPDTDEPATPIPNVSTGCSRSANISNPRSGTTISGALSISGTAADPQFSFYKLEVNGPETSGQWASLIGRTVNQPVENGFLGSANMSGWQNGSYSVRLTVIDNTSNEIGFCQIQIQLSS